MCERSAFMEAHVCDSTYAMTVVETCPLDCRTWTVQISSSYHCSVPLLQLLTTVTLAVPLAAVCVLCTWRKIMMSQLGKFFIFCFAKKVLIYHDSIRVSLFWFSCYAIIRHLAKSRCCFADEQTQHRVSPLNHIHWFNRVHEVSVFSVGPWFRRPFGSQWKMLYFWSVWCKSRLTQSLCWHSRRKWRHDEDTNNNQAGSGLPMNLLEPFHPVYVWKCLEQRTQNKTIFINMFLLFAYFSRQLTVRVTLRVTGDLLKDNRHESVEHEDIEKINSTTCCLTCLFDKLQLLH